MSVDTASISLSIVQAAQATGLSKRYVAELVGRGELPSIKIGSRRLILVDDLKKYLTERRDVHV